VPRVPSARGIRARVHRKGLKPQQMGTVAARKKGAILSHQGGKEVKISVVGGGRNIEGVATKGGSHKANLWKKRLLLSPKGEKLNANTSYNEENHQTEFV